MTKLADATPERIADHFVNYLFAEYYGDRHVRRVASWVGLIVLGIEKLMGHRYVPTPVSFVLITLGGLSKPNIITKLAHVEALISSK